MTNAESSCCNGGSNPKPPKPVKEKKEKPKKEKPEKKSKKEKGGAPAEGTAAEGKEKDPKSSGKDKKDEKAKPVPVQVKSCHTFRCTMHSILFDLIISFVPSFIYHLLNTLILFPPNYLRTTTLLFQNSSSHTHIHPTLWLNW